jgi:hypothetical protein
MTATRREADAVREIGSVTFRDSEPRRVPRGSDYAVMSPAMRKFLEAADKGEGLSTRSARARRLA